MGTSCQEKKWGNKSYHCYFDLTLQVIGGKWKLMILFHLSGYEKLRFGELRRTLHGITERMLVKQLRELEADGIVNRRVYNTVPPRVEYSLSDLGKSLIPIIQNMRAWGAAYERSSSGMEFPPEDGFEDASVPAVATSGEVKVVGTDVVCILSGEHFDPEAAIKMTGIPLEIQIKKGKKRQRGKYKGQVATFSSARIVGDFEHDLDMMLTLLAESKEVFQLLHVDDIYLDYIMTTDGDGLNWSLSKEQIAKLAMVDVDLRVTCVRE